jgi:TAG lipase / lysophosphatidylethanolamine acyltransferase
VAELFNVNHFIISQARPYLAPLLQSDFHRHNPRVNTRSWGLVLPIGRLIILEIQHRLKQLDSLGYMAPGIRRFLVDENIPGASLMFVPELTATDFVKLLERPTKESIENWILRGERSVWPAVSALTVRCAVETKLDGAYERVRRGVTYDVVADTWPRLNMRSSNRFRTRSTSLGQDTI